MKVIYPVMSFNGEQLTEFVESFAPNTDFNAKEVYTHITYMFKMYTICDSVIVQCYS